jgi:hypothetical protein
MAQEPKAPKQTKEPKAPKQTKVAAGSGPVPKFAEGKPTVDLAALQTAGVIVTDESGNFFYLEPVGRGVYRLRVVPANA